MYLAYDAVGWFGMPEEVAYYPTLIRTGVDGKGVAILRYADFTVTLNVGKTSNSFLPSEINGLRDAIVMDNPAELGQITYQDKDGQEHAIGRNPIPIQCWPRRATSQPLSMTQAITRRNT